MKAQREVTVMTENTIAPPRKPFSPQPRVQYCAGQSILRSVLTVSAIDMVDSEELLSALTTAGADRPVSGKRLFPQAGIALMLAGALAFDTGGACSGLGALEQRLRAVCTYPLKTSLDTALPKKLPASVRAGSAAFLSRAKGAASTGAAQSAAQPFFPVLC